MRGTIINKEFYETHKNEKKDVCSFGGAELIDGSFFISENTFDLFKYIFNETDIVFDIEVEFKKIKP